MVEFIRMDVGISLYRFNFSFSIFYLGGFGILCDCLVFICFIREMGRILVFFLWRY